MSAHDHIVTTHVGSLPRPAEFRDLMYRHQEGESVDSEIDARLSQAITDVVGWQVASGIDVVSDGEFSKPGFVNYVTDRYTGFDKSKPTTWSFHDLDVIPEVAAAQYADESFTHVHPPTNVGPIEYTGADETRRDIKNLQAAMDAHGVSRGFITAPSPGCVATHFGTEHYDSYESYLDACADALANEYRLVVESGLTLQVDCPDIPMLHPAHGRFWCTDVVERIGHRAFVEMQVAAINKALDGLPPEQLRMHLCWGNYLGTHHCDAPIADFLPEVLKARPSGLLFEAANPRHAHEWRAFMNTSIPDDKVLIPGVIDTVDVFVEHPQLVADRLAPFVELVGPDRVQAGTDCGFATFVGTGQAGVEVVELKLASMRAGAELAFQSHTAPMSEVK